MKLFPLRKPYKKGFFNVGDGHSLYYALYGNPKGIPVLFVHGGPGGGCGKFAYRQFNPKKFNILLVDQRGSGKSKPFASTKANTTQKLVEDFRKILDELHMDKVYLYGGSWGSFLSLCFAIAHPHRVKGMVLRGIYLGSGFDDDFLLLGRPKTHFPEIYARFVSHVPKGKHVLNYYWKMMNSKNKKVARKFCREWALYESSLCYLEYEHEKVLKETKGKWVVSIARIEAHYFKHNCFVPKNYILKNVDKIKNIPTVLVHGRYDFVCAPEGAYQLYRALPKSHLFFITAGHSLSEPKIREMLMKSIHKMAK